MWRCLMIMGLFLPLFGQASEPLPKAAPKKADTCLACHGREGVSPTPYWPHLAGQNTQYLIKQLKDYRSRERKDSIMAEMADPLTDDDIEVIAQYMSTLTRPEAIGKDELGAQIYRNGIPERNIPPCTPCHGPDGKGLDGTNFAIIAGQRGDYLRRQILDFRNGRRTNDAAGAMTLAVKDLKYSEVMALVRWLSSPKGESRLHR